VKNPLHIASKVEYTLLLGDGQAIIADNEDALQRDICKLNEIIK
jgi:hypothetical protein